MITRVSTPDVENVALESIKKHGWNATLHLDQQTKTKSEQHYWYIASVYRDRDGDEKM